MTENKTNSEIYFFDVSEKKKKSMLVGKSSEFGSEKGLTPGQLRRIGESETK